MMTELLPDFETDQPALPPRAKRWLVSQGRLSVTLSDSRSVTISAVQKPQLTPVTPLLHFTPRGLAHQQYKCIPELRIAEYTIYQIAPHSRVRDLHGRVRIAIPCCMTHCVHRAHAPFLHSKFQQSD
jgi:hypothetical protein